MRYGWSILILALVAASGSDVCAGTIYKSVGPDGAVVYSDHPPASGKVEKTFEFADLPSSPVALEQARDTKPAPAHTGSPGGIALFSASWCGYCRRAKAYLAQKGIPYRNVDIESADGRQQFASAGGGGIPLLFNGGKHIRGFSADGYDAFFRGR
jgi:glutaredoxin